MALLKINTQSLRELANQVEKELGAEKASAALAQAAGAMRDFARQEIGRQVSGRYAISAQDVISGADSRGQSNLNVGDVRGSSGSWMEIVYTGRVLTLGAHFQYSPHRPKTRKYRVTSTILNGKSATHSPYSFIPMSDSYMGDLVWKRDKRGNVSVVHTLSIPQMVSSEKLEQPITQAIGKRLEEEFIKAWEARK